MKSPKKVKKIKAFVHKYVAEHYKELGIDGVNIYSKKPNKDYVQVEIHIKHTGTADDVYDGSYLKWKLPMWDSKVHLDELNKDNPSNQ